MLNTLYDYDDAIKTFTTYYIKFSIYPINNRNSIKLTMFGLPELEIKTINIGIYAIVQLYRVVT